MPILRLDARYVVAFQDGEHRLLENGTVVVDGDRVVYTGRDYQGPADERVDAGDTLVTPGFINTHAHLETAPLDKSFQEDVGKRQFFSTGLVETLPMQENSIDEEGVDTCIDVSMSELIRTGTTTVMHQGLRGRRVAEACERAGLRAYIADGYRSGRWFTPDGNRVAYEWDEDGGFAGLERAVRLIEELRDGGSGRVRGFLSPWQANTCTPDLLKESRRLSDDLEVPLTIHAAQAMFEVMDVMAAHGMTPIEYLESAGFLGPRVVLGHAIFTTGTSWLNLPGDDLRRIADSGASISYNAWTFARRGIMVESLPGYRRAGVNITLGTDTTPQSMIESIRWSAILGKVADRRADSWLATHLLDAATVNAARLLGRDDLGRIAPGAKADLLLWRLDTPVMSPVRDPIRNLVYYATREDLASVMIDGAWVMRDGALLTVDEEGMTERLQRAGERSWARVPDHDRLGRTLEEVAPSSLRPFR
ncbi:amidohydrolase family protein [Microbispora amethystogenes]|uniref:Ethylammeline chlorohydrolase n=1 Tax=Microbispora amethystogenes TaxID=1427754 RepID=A0ABQ4FE41_9ACTN|nr:amidohydrolase family protein [Microbispora amethystogenes]GIH33053.1 ethylammeline chlorohydrolase [Microbispora amethystogenes]